METVTGLCTFLSDLSNLSKSPSECRVGRGSARSEGHVKNWHIHPSRVSMTWLLRPEPWSGLSLGLRQEGS